MRVLLVGDIVGKGGRQAACHLIPSLRNEFNCCFCIANAENVAGGSGLTEKCVTSLLDHGVDVITAGDHVWGQRDFVGQIERFPNVLRPANFNKNQPGSGYGVYNIPIGGKIGIVNVIGQLFIGTLSNSPFAAVDEALAKIERQTKSIFVEIHAEATSEKCALGRYLDGRATAVWGTHTHVPTADGRVLPNGTAFITDIGMVGAAESIIGRDISAVLKRFTTGLPARLKVIDDDIVLNGAIVDFDANTGKATGIQRVERRTGMTL